MKRVKCKVCRSPIALVNGPVKELKCDKCGATRKLHYKNKPQGFKLTMRI